LRAASFLRASWLCVSPEAYDQAMERQAGKQGKAFDELKEQLLLEKLCTYLAGRDFTKIMTAVRILETKGELVRVTFTMRMADQMPAAQRGQSFHRLTMWTGRDNLSKEE
jgi:hypothetical protein